MPSNKKNPAAVALGRRGGRARMQSMTAEERHELAIRAGQASGESRRAKAKQREEAEAAVNA